MASSDKVEVLFVNYDPFRVDHRYLAQAATQVLERIPSIAVIVLCPRADDEHYKPLEFRVLGRNVAEEIKKLVNGTELHRPEFESFSPDLLIEMSLQRIAAGWCGLSPKQEMFKPSPCQQAFVDKAVKTPSFEDLPKGDKGYIYEADASAPSMPDLGPMKYGNIINKSLGYAAGQMMEKVPPVNPVPMKLDPYLKACADPNHKAGQLRLVIDNGTRYVFDLHSQSFLPTPTVEYIDLAWVKKKLAHLKAVNVKTGDVTEKDWNHFLKMDLTTTKVEIDEFQTDGTWKTVKVL